MMYTHALHRLATWRHKRSLGLSMQLEDLIGDNVEVDFNITMQVVGVVVPLVHALSHGGFRVA
jgi:hypothetical protein